MKKTEFKETSVMFSPNTCFMTDVPFVKSKHWVYGHDHTQGEFEKFGVKFHTNQLGYPYEN